VKESPKFGKMYTIIMMTMCRASSNYKSIKHLILLLRCLIKAVQGLLQVSH